jgi:short-subunit dehydrogenase
MKIILADVEEKSLSLAESQMKAAGADIKVSVICPGVVNTNIMDAERNRPERYLNDPSWAAQNPELDDMEEAFREMMKSGMPPAVLAEIVFEAIKEEKFYIITHPEMKPIVQMRMDGIIEERNPVPPPMTNSND